MSAQGSITGWIQKLRQGDDDAAQALWDRYFPELIGLARQRLWADARRVADEEDVVLSAFGSFFRRVGDSEHLELKNRDDLWRILSRKTRDKAVDLIRRNRRLKRGGEASRSATAPGVDLGTLSIYSVDPPDPDPTPDLIVLVEETCRAMLDGLPDAQMRQIAVSRMEGFTNREIANTLGCSLATVERRLNLIRRLWQGQRAS